MELVAGHVTFVYNMGNGGGRALRDASPVVLNDDQWHEVSNTWSHTWDVSGRPGNTLFKTCNYWTN